MTPAAVSWYMMRPLARRRRLSNMWNTSLDGWWIVATTVRPASARSLRILQTCVCVRERARAREREREIESERER
jgi:hypothetical protein